MNENKNIEYEDCPICCDSHLKSSLVSCPFCKYICCKGCIQQYLLGKKSVNAECMNCHKEWDYEFIANITSNKFHNHVYRKHRATVLLEMEKSLLPATQALAIEEIKRRKIKRKIPDYTIKKREKEEKIKEILKAALTISNDEIEELGKNIKIINKEKKELTEKKNWTIMLLKEDKVGKTRDQKAIINKQIDTVKEKYKADIDSNKIKWNKEIEIYNIKSDEIRNKYYALQSSCDNKIKHLSTKFGRYKLDSSRHVWEATSENKVATYTYRAPCPTNDCKGYVDDKWKCGLCEKKVCAQCHQIKYLKKDKEYKGPHVCNEDDKKTAELLAKDTKPCPKCSVSIYKISGCDQMWCTNCHTVFSWKTGQINKGNIHNPHYFEWKRKQAKNGVIARNPLDVRCGGAPTIGEIQWKIRELEVKSSYVLSNVQWIGEILRKIIHIREVTLPMYPIINGMLDNLDLRVKYLVGDIDEEKWTWHLKKRDKKKQKDKMINNVLSMYIDAATNLSANMLESKSEQDMIDTITELHNLQNYALQSLSIIKDKFNNQVPKSALKCDSKYYEK